MPENNIAETAAELTRQAAKAHIVKAGDGREFLIVPEGMTKHDINNEHGLKVTTPAYLKQDVTLQTVDSLVDYVNRFKGADSVLFADISASTIAALLDYHAAAKDGAEPGVKRAAHRSIMALPFSEEWKLWTAIDGNLQGQLDFARFIAETAADIIAPPAGELLDAMRDLQAHRKVNFIKAVRTQSENENFEFSDESEVRTKGGIEVPTKFVLKLPVYFGEPPTELHAFLRWKIDPEKGGLSLGIRLHRKEHVRQAVFQQIVLAVGERTGCPVVFGKAG